MLASATRRRRRRCWSLVRRMRTRIVSVDNPTNRVFVRRLSTIGDDESGRREMVKDDSDVESDCRLDLMSATEYSS